MSGWRRAGVEARRAGLCPHLQARITSSRYGWRRTGASSASPPIRSASGPGGSGRSCRRAIARRPRASIRSTPSSSIRTAACIAPSVSASPMLYDQAHGRTGSFLMVHGGCASVGCYAVTDPVVDEIWRLVTAALDKGQPRFPVHAFPFRMTDANLRLRRGSTLGRLLGRPEDGLRPVRAEPDSAGGQRLQWPLRLRAGNDCHRQQRRRGALPAGGRRQSLSFTSAIRRA